MGCSTWPLSISLLLKTACCLGPGCWTPDLFLIKWVFSDGTEVLAVAPLLADLRALAFTFKFLGRFFRFSSLETPLICSLFIVLPRLGTFSLAGAFSLF